MISPRKNPVSGSLRPRSGQHWCATPSAHSWHLHAHVPSEIARQTEALTARYSRARLTVYDQRGNPSATFSRTSSSGSRRCLLPSTEFRPPCVRCAVTCQTSLEGSSAKYRRQTYSACSRMWDVGCEDKSQRHLMCKRLQEASAPGVMFILISLTIVIFIVASW